MARVGVFGGTFDPPHIGHLIVAQELVERLRLERMLVMPAAAPPHKEDAAAPAAVRLRMVEAALAGDPRLEASALEVERGGRSYTVDTLRALTAAAPDDALFLPMGADQYRTFGAWRSHREVARLARVVVVARGDDPGGPDADGVEVTRVRVSRVDVSSTDIRGRVAEGRPIRYRVPEAVRQIIEDERLYLNP